MQFQLVDPNRDFVESLKKKTIHLVGFAELGMAFFRDYIVSAYGFSMDAAIDICKRINESNETGTIYPLGNLTGIPVRYFRQEMQERDKQQFIICLSDAFKANKDYIQSPKLVFHFACAISNQDYIVDEVIRMGQEVNDPYLEQIIIVVDNPVPTTDLQRIIFNELH